jgi:hypothetical protein
MPMHITISTAKRLCDKRTELNPRAERMAGRVSVLMDMVGRVGVEPTAR